MSPTPSAPVLPRRALLLGAAAIAAGAGLVWRGWHRTPAVPAAGEAAAEGLGAATVVADREPVPDFAVTGLHGPLTRASLQGRWQIVFFGYTQCPDVCPGSLTLLKEALSGLPPDRRPGVLFISVDPARDTVELLGQYLPAFDPSFDGAVGSDASIAALVKHLGVRYERHAPGPSGSYTVDHTASLFLLDPQARLHAVFSPPHQAAAVRAALTRLMG